MKEKAETYLNKTVDSAVIITPAHFNYYQINAPTATAILYGLDRKAAGHETFFSLILVVVLLILSLSHGKSNFRSKSCC